MSDRRNTQGQVVAKFRMASGEEMESFIGTWQADPLDPQRLLIRLQVFPKDGELTLLLDSNQ